MTAEFWITITAIVMGPLAAVLITHFLQKKNDLKQRRLFVFRALMASRRTPLSLERVQALNLVEVEFHNQVEVLNKFKTLIDTYNDQMRWKSDDLGVRTNVIQEVDDKTSKLLSEMGKVLGYRLENLSLLRGGYHPEAFSTLENQQQEIREFFVGLNNGSKALPVAVLDVRHPEGLLEQARQTQLLLSIAQNAKGPVDE